MDEKKFMELVAELMEAGFTQKKQLKKLEIDFLKDGQKVVGRQTSRTWWC